MKKFILTTLISLSLTACGDDSEKQAPTEQSMRVLAKTKENKKYN